MKRIFSVYVVLFCLLSNVLFALPSSWETQSICSTEGDPEAFLEGQVNLALGTYCEVVTDLVLQGGQEFALTRYYSGKTPHERQAGWRLFPHCFLTVGEDPASSAQAPSASFFAYSGEMSGSQLLYSGNAEELRLDVARFGKGACATARGKLSGQTSLHNHLLQSHHDKRCYTLTLGDGKERLFEEVLSLPASLPGIYSFRLNHTGFDKEKSSGIGRS